MSEPAHLQGLNLEQHEAVCHVEGPLLVLAGAGSGKTRVLTRRVAHLVHQGVPPHAILAVTFTNKAAGEMRERVEELVGAQARRIVVSTFHSACARFLRRDAPRLGFTSSFVIYDSDDQLRMVKNILRDFKLDPKRHPPRGYLARIDDAKNRLLEPADVAAGQLGQPLPPGMRLDEVFQRYEAALVAANAFDFNDLVNRMVRLLEQHPEVRQHYLRRFRFLLVDEYQDTNHAQYRLIKALAALPPHNLAVVGDDDQSIYAFRGADIRNILDFERDFPSAKVVRLERNYRSTGNILAAAGSVVRNNRGRKEKTLWTKAPSGDPVQLLVGRDEEDEAARVVREIRELFRQGRRPGDIAVFYRTHASSRPLEQAMGKARIPHKVVGGRRFYERREVRDLVAWLRLLLNPTDSMAFLRIVNVPPRGIGATTVQRLRQQATDDGVPVLEAARRHVASGRGRTVAAVASFVKLVDSLTADAQQQMPAALILQVAEETGYLAALQAEDTLEAQGRLENIEALARAARALQREGDPDAEAFDDPDEPVPVALSTEPRAALQAFLEQASLASADQDLPDDDGQVTLMTVHLAKGLEFPVVFVVGLVENVFPHLRSSERLEDLEEERRLAYVAFTRARERLYLCRPTRRWVRGAATARGGAGRFSSAAPSMFLREVPSHLLRSVGAGAFTGPRPPRPVRSSIPASSTRRLDALLAQVRADDSRRQDPAPAFSGTTMVPDDPEAFAPGVRVRHPAFGIGEVRRREGHGAGLKLLVFFERLGPRKLRVRDCRLEVLVD